MTAGEVVDLGPFVEKDGEDTLMMCFDREFLFLTLISSLLTLFMIYSKLRMNAKGLFKKGYMVLEKYCWFMVEVGRMSQSNQCSLRSQY